MPLNEFVVDVPIVGGLAEDEDERLTTKPLQLLNCRYNKAGTIGRRNGYEVLSTYGGEGVTSAVSTSNTLVLNSSEKIWCFSDNTDINDSTDKGIATSVTAQTAISLLTPVIAGERTITSIDVAVAGNYKIVTWVETTLTATTAYILSTAGTAYYAIFDKTTNETIIPKATVATNCVLSKVAVGIDGNDYYIHFIYGDYGTTDIKYKTLSSTSGINSTLSSATTLFSDAATNYESVFDVHCDTATGNNIAIAYYKDNGTDYVHVERFDAQSTTLSSLASVDISLPVGVDTVVYGLGVYWDNDNDRVWIGACYQATGPAEYRVYLYGYENDLSTVIRAAYEITQPAPLQNTEVPFTSISIYPSSATALYLAISSQTGRSYLLGAVTALASSPVPVLLSAEGSALPGFVVLSKIFKYNSKYYVLTQTRGSGSTYVLVQINPPSTARAQIPASILYPNVTNYLLSNNVNAYSMLYGSPCSSVSISSTRFDTCMLSPVSSSTESYKFKAENCQFEFNHVSSLLSWQGQAIRCGGVPSLYDLLYLNPLGVIGTPGNVTTGINATGALPNGAYISGVLPVVVNTKGYVQRGYPATYTTTISGGPDSIDINIPALGIAYEYTRIFFELYRSTINGSILYRLNSDIPATALHNTITNASGFVYYPDRTTYNDNNVDADIDDHQILYTTGGVLPNIPPPSARLGHIWNNRLWLADTPDGTVWYSKTFVQNEFPAFASAFVLTPFQTGRVTGLSSLDDKLLVFYEDAVWALTGDGPNDTGAGASFSTPTKIVDGIGCVESRSIVQTQQGVVFQAKGGLYLLGRDLTINYFSGPIQDSIDGRTITSAVDVDGQKELRFTVGSGSLGFSTGQGILAWDYQNGTWSADELTSDSADINAALVYDSKYTIIQGVQDTTKYRILQESSGAYLDYLPTNGTSKFVPMTFETSNIHLQSIQGYQMVWEAVVLTKRHSNYTITISVAYDYSTTYTDTYTFSNETSGTVGQFSITLSQQECSAVRFKVEITEPSSVGTGQAATITGISLVCGVGDNITKRVAPDKRK